MEQEEIEQSWEKEFNERFYPIVKDTKSVLENEYNTGHFWGTKETLEKCRDFIRETRTSAYERGVRDSLETLPKKSYRPRGANARDNGIMYGWDRCRDDAQEAISTLLK